MLALIYLALAIYIDDFLCRRFYRFVSIDHRSAAAVITGLLISSWFTYLAGLLSRAVGGRAPALANRENGFAPFLLFPIMKRGRTRFDLR